MILYSIYNLTSIANLSTITFRAQLICIIWSFICTTNASAFHNAFVNLNWVNWRSPKIWINRNIICTSTLCIAWTLLTLTLVILQIIVSILTWNTPIFINIIRFLLFIYFSFPSQTIPKIKIKNYFLLCLYGIWILKIKLEYFIFHIFLSWCSFKNQIFEFCSTIYNSNLLCTYNLGLYCIKFSNYKITMKIRNIKHTCNYHLI